MFNSQGCINDQNSCAAWAATNEAASGEVLFA